MLAARCSSLDIIQRKLTINCICNYNHDYSRATVSKIWIWTPEAPIPLLACSSISSTTKKLLYFRSQLTMKIAIQWLDCPQSILVRITNKFWHVLHLYRIWGCLFFDISPETENGNLLLTFLLLIQFLASNNYLFIVISDRGDWYIFVAWKNIVPSLSFSYR